jgi:hypothetical protein
VVLLDTVVSQGHLDILDSRVLLVTVENQEFQDILALVATPVILALVDILGKVEHLVIQVLVNLEQVVILENLEHQVTVVRVEFLGTLDKAELLVIQDKAVFQAILALVNLVLLVILVLASRVFLDILEIVVLVVTQVLVILVQVVIQVKVEPLGIRVDLA